MTFLPARIWVEAPFLVRFSVICWTCLGSLSGSASAIEPNAKPVSGFVEESVYNSQEFDQPRWTPEETIADVKLPEGFRLNVAAKSPDVRQPIGMCWDRRGRLWVAENYTYAESEKNFDLELSDRIVIFEDTDHDGAFDKRSVFWDAGKRLTSIELGYGGVWAMAPPYLLFLPDQDQDDHVDSEPQIVLDGFDCNAVRHNLANGLRWGPDGWLYGRHGIQAVSKVGPLGAADSDRTAFSCAIWRWHPIRKQFDVVCEGTTNAWGMDWDQYGQLFFINTVIGHLWHAIPGAHLQRMYGDDADANVYELMQQIADHYHFDNGKEDWTAVRKGAISDGTDAAGGGHAHSGMMIYQGTAWPEAYHQRLFTLNFHGRRINVERLDRQGSGFVGRHEPDFMLIKDPWFRGIELSAGPDGAVYVLDWSDTGECHENDGVHRQSGTIYRLSFGEQSPSGPMEKLDALDNQALIQYAISDDVWLERQSRQILAERAVLKKIQQSEYAQINALLTQSDSEKVRLRALWLLCSCQQLSSNTLHTLMKDASEHVRAYAVRLLPETSHEDASKQSLDLNVLAELAISEPSDLVAMQVASALQNLRGDRWWGVMACLLQRKHLDKDRDFTLMLWYAMRNRVIEDPQQATRTLATIYANEKTDSSNVPFEKLTRFTARRFSRASEVSAVPLNELLTISMEAGPRMKRDIIEGMQLGFAGRRKMIAPDAWKPLLDSLDTTSSLFQETSFQTALRSLKVVFGDGMELESLAQIVSDKSIAIETRATALRSLTEGRSRVALDLAKKHLYDAGLSAEAIATIAALGNVDDVKALITDFGNAQGSRAAASTALIKGLTSKREFMPMLFEGIRSRRIPAESVDASALRQIQLMGNQEDLIAIRELWPKATLMGSDKIQKIMELESLIAGGLSSENADASRGRLHWNKLCASCHKLFGEGGDIGPELTGAQRTNPRYLSENIMDPSAAVATNYRVSLLMLEGGRILTGVIVQEDASICTVQTAKERIVVAKDEIEERRQSNQSLMPEGLLDTLDDQSKRDLMAYLMSSRQVAVAGD